MMFTFMSIHITAMWPEDFTQDVYRGEAIEAVMKALMRHSTQRIIVNRDITENDIPDWDDITSAHDARTGKVTPNNGNGAIITKGVMHTEYAGTTYAYTCTHCWTPSRILDAYRTGLVSGRDAAGTCDTATTITRAELCQILYNAGLTEAGMLHSDQVDF